MITVKQAKLADNPKNAAALAHIQAALTGDTSTGLVYLPPKNLRHAPAHRHAGWSHRDKHDHEPCKSYSANLLRRKASIVIEGAILCLGWLFLQGG